MTAGLLKRRKFLQISTQAALVSLACTHSVMAAVSLDDDRQSLIDCHHHIYDHRFHPRCASLEEYRLFQKRLGIKQHVIIQPSLYGSDNTCLLESLRQCGRQARAVAVCRKNQTSEHALQEMHQLGVRGLRLNLIYPGGCSLNDIESLLGPVSRLGWHLEILARPDLLYQYRTFITQCPVPAVLDHMAHLRPPDLETPIWDFVHEQLISGNLWMKLSGFYIFSRSGPPFYQDIHPVVQKLLAVAPHRLVWGSNWPHPTIKHGPGPDDTHLVAMLRQWIRDPFLERMIFSQNAEHLYQF